MESFDYIQAAKGSCLMDRSQEDRTEMVRVAVTRAYELKGLPLPSGADLQFIINETERKVASMYPYMTGQELTILTEQGVAGELTRDTRPSASAIFGWMAAYMNGDARKEALRNYRRNIQWHGEQDGPSPAEVAELNRAAEQRAITALWREYRTTGKIADDHLDGYVAMAMDGAVKRGLFAIRDEHWEHARNLARRDRLRQMGSSWVNSALPYDPVFLTKRHLLLMCFAGQKATGRDLVVNA